MDDEFDTSQHPWSIAHRKVMESQQRQEHRAPIAQADYRRPLGDVTDAVVNDPQYDATHDNNFYQQRHKQPPTLIIDRRPEPPSPPRPQKQLPPHLEAIKNQIHEDIRAQKEADIKNAEAGISSKNGIKTHVGPWLLGRTVGKGSSGRVRKARHRLTQELAAIKIMSKRDAIETQWELGSFNGIEGSDAEARQKHEMLMPLSIEREVAMLKLIDHPNILRMFDVWENRSEIYLVVEYVPRGDLFEFLGDYGPLREREAVFFFRQIMSAVEYCHSLNICHRDLKCENILVGEGGIMKIADFGLAALQQTPTQVQTTFCGSPHYASPELASGHRSTGYDGKKSDIWSMGIIMFAMMTCLLPFDGPEVETILKAIVTGMYVMPKQLGVDAKEFIKRILVAEPNHRIPIKEMWKMPLIGKYKHMEHEAIGGDTPPDVRQEVEHGPVHPNQIDPEIFRQLHIMWHMFTDEDLTHLLTCAGNNDQKLFYWLLYRYRERILEDYNLNLPHSKSDYHHIRPGVKSSVVEIQRTCEFSNNANNGDGDVSRFTVIANDDVGSPGTTASYDPYRATTISQLQHTAASRSKITVHLPNVSIHRTNSTRSRTTGLSRTNSKISTAGFTHRGNHQRLRSSPRGSMASLANRHTFASQAKASYARPVHRSKRAVDFSHIRFQTGVSDCRSTTGASRTRSVRSVRRQLHGGAEISGGLGKQQRERNITPSLNPPSKAIRSVAKPTDLVQQEYDQEQMREFSSSIANHLDQAFKSTIPSSPPSTPGVLYRGTQDTDNIIKTEMSSLDYGTPLATSTPCVKECRVSVKDSRIRHSGCSEQPWDTRPLPEAPPRTESVINEMIKAKDDAERSQLSGASSDSPDHLNRVVSHLNRLVQPVLSFKKSSALDCVDRRISSDPTTSATLRPNTMAGGGGANYRHSTKPLSNVYDEDSTFLDVNTTNVQSARHVSAPEPPMVNLNSSSIMQTPDAHREHRGLDYLSKAQRTIRVVHSPSAIGAVHPSAIGAAHVPAPLNVQKRNFQISAGPIPKSPQQVTENARPTATRHRYPENQSTVRQLYDRHSRAVSERQRPPVFQQKKQAVSSAPVLSSPTAHRAVSSGAEENAAKKAVKKWFRRSKDLASQTPAFGVDSNVDKQSLQKVTSLAGATVATTTSGWTKETNPFESMPGAIPPVGKNKKGSRFPFWKREKKAAGEILKGIPELVISGNDIPESPTAPPQMSMDLLDSRRTSSAPTATTGPASFSQILTPAGDVATPRTIQVHQNWLARLFRVKPATRHLCFTVGRRRARQEVAILFKEWKKYGIQDIEVDKERNVVFARVGETNYLHIRPVSIAATVSMVREHGNSSPLAIVRLIQERGAASSFTRVADTMETVFNCRGLLVKDKEKCKRIMKTLDVVVAVASDPTDPEVAAAGVGCVVIKE